MIVFTLTMPNRNTWNGKWTGDGRVFAIPHMGKRLVCG